MVYPERRDSKVEGSPTSGWGSLGLRLRQGFGGQVARDKV